MEKSYWKWWLYTEHDDLLLRKWWFKDLHLKKAGSYYLCTHGKSHRQIGRSASTRPHRCPVVASFNTKFIIFITNFNIVNRYCDLHRLPVRVGQMLSQRVPTPAHISKNEWENPVFRVSSSATSPRKNQTSGRFYSNPAVFRAKGARNVAEIS